MTTQETLLTADELLKLPDDRQRRELLDGVLVEMSPPGGRHGLASGNVLYALRTWAVGRRMGTVLTEVGVILRRDPDRVCAPDVCFLSRDRMPAVLIPAGYLEIVPDLIVEVVSPTDRPREVREKAEEWVRAGAGLAWVVDPERGTVEVYRAGVASETRTATDMLDAEPVLLGFAVAAGDLFA